MRPNVILVLTDDQGYGDLSCHGNPILKTPNMDRLQAQSIRFIDFHVAPMCTPTRGQLMTGRDAVDNGASYVNRRSMMREGLPTMADVFRANGYRTGLFGKWHLGDSYPHRPNDRGFDTSVHHESWGITSIADRFGNDYFDDTYLHNNKDEKYEGYCTDVWFNEAMRWMKECHAKNEPFFCYVPTNAAHTPHWVDEKYAKPYQGKKVPAKFFGMIANLDENLGRMQKFLDENGLTENTIFIFMTDNGTASGEKVFNAGMRDKKRSYYDGGHRVPCFVHWPEGKLGPAREIDTLTQVQDLLPTLIELCGLTSPENADFDGISLAGLLRGEKTSLRKLDERMLVVQYGVNPQKQDAAVLWNKWRLVHGKELYRIDQDPGQKQDLATDHPEIVQKMRGHYERWWKDVQPAIQETVWIDLGAKQANPTMLYASDWQGDYADNWGNLAPGKAVGQWNVRVKQPGRYTLTLYRWPPEANTALDAPLTGPSGKGKAVPIRAARLEIGNFDAKSPTAKDAASITFTIDLTPGEYVLKTRFFDAQDKPLCSAYYVKAERIK